MRLKRTMALAFVGGATLLGGCYDSNYTPMQPVATAPRPVTVAVAPPEPAVEQPSPSPYPGAVWMAGYWDWRADMGRHVWVAGKWATPPRPGVVYMPPRWVPDGAGRYYRTNGQWLNDVSHDPYGRHVYYDAAGRAHYF